MYKVILIDDEIWVLRGLESIIDWKQYGFEICGTCRSAEQAIEAIRQFKPDIIFTDIRMPHMSGMELMETSDVKNQAPLIVIVSAYRDFDVAKDAIKKGVFDYLIKPLEREIVIEVVKRAKIQLDHRYAKVEQPPYIDLEREESDAFSGIKELIRRVTVDGDCYVCISEEKIRNWQLWKEYGNVTEVIIPPYQEAFLYSGNLPDSTSEGLMGISIRRDNFTQFRDMLREAICALEGGFVFSRKKKVAEIQMYIASNYRDKLTTKKIAEHFYLSEAYIYELFQKYGDNTITGFLKCVRMNHACRLFSSSDLSIREVGEAVGFEDAGYFSRVFKSYFGDSPDNFRS